MAKKLSLQACLKQGCIFYKIIESFCYDQNENTRYSAFTKSSQFSDFTC